MRESDIMRKIQVDLTQEHARLFRNNVAKGWIGNSIVIQDKTAVTLNKGDVVIRKARRLISGLCVGSSDLIGWNRYGKFLAVEVKSKYGIITLEQKNFLHQVNKSGGIGFASNSPEEAKEVLTRLS